MLMPVTTDSHQLCRPFNRAVVRREDEVGEARRAVALEVSRVCSDTAFVERARLVTTELARNMTKHTSSGGEVLYRCYETHESQVICEILGIDRGPGIANLRRALADGFSTAGTAGIGLGSIHRLSDEFDITTAPGQGTVVLARLGTDRRAFRLRRPQGYRLAGLCVPKPGETHCGDAWTFADDGHQLTILVVDGLGHGEQAQEAALQAVNRFQKDSALPLEELLMALDAACKPTRGAAAAVARIDFREGTLSYAGVGNIAATIFFDTHRKGLVSQNGIVGSAQGRPFLQKEEFAEGSSLILHSDGIHSRWSTESGPANKKEPLMRAAQIYQDAARGRDDATVVVLDFLTKPQVRR